MSVDLKRELLSLLERDVEFRYAVAGYLGISETLKRLDTLTEELKKLSENQNRLWEEVRSLRKDQNRLWEEIRSLRENQGRLWEEVRKLWEEVRDMRVTLNRVATTLDRLTISVEEEALSCIRHRLRERLGVDVELRRLFVDAKEINIYGAVGDLCVIGEATVRLGTGLIDELREKVKLIREKRPELLKPKLVKVIYADYATPDAIEYAKREKVWVLKWSGDLTPMTIDERGID